MALTRRCALTGRGSRTPMASSAFRFCHVRIGSGAAAVINGFRCRTRRPPVKPASPSGVIVGNRVAESPYSHIAVSGRRLNCSDGGILALLMKRDGMSNIAALFAEAVTSRAILKGRRRSYDCLQKGSTGVTLPIPSLAYAANARYFS
ncbi:hypothetical protein KCP73_01905 [Salmonella enterica subsp. enterica]|nr:hypothetical protein KCP73_01905 [Salmonella enterica subsp. enterica]